MNSSTDDRASDGRTDGFPDGISLDITDGAGLAGLLGLGLGADSDRDRDGDGYAGPGSDLHVCGPLCGRPFGGGSGSGVDGPGAGAPVAGGDPRRAAAPPVGPPRHARKVSWFERRALDRQARLDNDAASADSFRAALDGSW